MGLLTTPAIARGRPPMILPPEAHPLLNALVYTFTNPTYQRFSTLLVAAVLTTGRRTIANLLRTLRHLAPGHPTDYRRVLSRAPWSGLALGCALARFLLDRLIPDGPVHLVGDDTVDGHPGRTVYGKCRHRDPVRSTHAYTAWRYGHKWVVLAVLVKFPFATRRWALPVLIDLYRTPEVSTAEGVRHRTPARLMCRLLRLLLARFPDRTFVFTGDSGYGTHEVARFCHVHRAERLAVAAPLLLAEEDEFRVEVDVFDPRPEQFAPPRAGVRGRDEERVEIPGARLP